MYSHYDQPLKHGYSKLGGASVHMQHQKNFCTTWKNWKKASQLYLTLLEVRRNIKRSLSFSINRWTFSNSIHHLRQSKLATPALKQESSTLNFSIKSFPCLLGCKRLFNLSFIQISVTRHLEHETSSTKCLLIRKKILLFHFVPQFCPLNGAQPRCEPRDSCFETTLV